MSLLLRMLWCAQTLAGWAIAVAIECAVAADAIMAWAFAWSVGRRLRNVRLEGGHLGAIRRHDLGDDCASGTAWARRYV